MKLLIGLILTLFLAVSAYAAELALDPEHSEIRWAGSKVGGAHDGVVKIKEGFVNFDGEHISAGRFVVDMGTIQNYDLKSDTYREKLENHLKSDDFFDIAKFPTAVFEITESTPTGMTEEGKTFSVTGTLTVKGISHPITFPVTIVETDGRYQGTGMVILDRTKWDVRYNSGRFFDPKRLGDKLIYDEFKIDIKITTKA